MKKLIICLLTLFALSCSLPDDNGLSSYTEFTPIESVEMPQIFTHNEAYEINITFNKPSSCHSFLDIFLDTNANEHTVAIISQVNNSGNGCMEVSTSQDVSFQLIVSELETYIFKFWQGQNSNGEDEYLIYEVPVEQ